MQVDIFAKLKPAVLEIGDRQLNHILLETESRLNMRRKPLMMLVTDHAGGREALELLCRAHPAAGFLKQSAQKAGSGFRLILSAGTQDQVLAVNGRDIRAELAWEGLACADLAVYCGWELQDITADLLESASALVLVTNTSMALPLTERTWLRETVLPLVGGAWTATAVHSPHLANSREELNQVLEGMETALNLLNPTVTLLRQEDPLSWLVTAAASGDPENRRQRAVYVHTLAQIQAQTENLLKLAAEDTESLSSRLTALESTLREVKTSGWLTVEHLVETMFDKLELQIVTALDRYSDEARASIARRISVTKKLQADTEKIEPYLRKVWENFMDKVQEYGSEELGSAALTLSARVEADALQLTGVPLEDLNPAVAFADFALAILLPAPVAMPSLQKPLFGGTREEMRSQVLAAVDGECIRIRGLMEQGLHQELARCREISRQQVTGVYSSMLDAAAAAARKTAQERTRLVQMQQKLRFISETLIPEVKSWL